MSLTGFLGTKLLLNLKQAESLWVHPLGYRYANILANCTSWPGANPLINLKIYVQDQHCPVRFLQRRNPSAAEIVGGDYAESGLRFGY